MAQNISIWGANYTAVPAVTLPKTGGGSATFTDTSDADATADDILEGKTAYVNGAKLTGTGQGGGGASDFEVNTVTINTNKAQTYMLPVVYDDAGYPPDIVSTSIYIRANTPTTLNLLFYKGRCYTGLDNSMWGMTGAVDYDWDYGYWYFTGSGTVHMEYD